MSFGNRIMEHTLAYRLWQRPFQEQKFAPIARHNDLARASSVLDVGCGPGTNASFFKHTNYLGVDINEGYIAYARERYKMRFLAADVSRWSMDGLGRFDFVFVNSFFHHVPDDDAATILARLHRIVASGGHLHVLDLVLPRAPSAARLLARWDRGDYPRPLERWRQLLGEWFEPVVFEPFAVTGFGLPLWHLVYFKGSPRLDAASHESVA